MEDPDTVYTIYPPPGAKEIMYFGYNTCLDRVIVVLMTGSICVYRNDNIERTSILERMIHSNQIKDNHNISLSQKITSVTFSSTIPPNYDVEGQNL